MVPPRHLAYTIMMNVIFGAELLVTCTICLAERTTDGRVLVGRQAPVWASEKRDDNIILIIARMDVIFDVHHFVVLD